MEVTLSAAKTMTENLPESDGSDSECGKDNDRESSGEHVAINSGS